MVYLVQLNQNATHRLQTWPWCWKVHVFGWCVGKLEFQNSSSSVQNQHLHVATVQSISLLFEFTNLYSDPPVIQTQTAINKNHDGCWRYHHCLAFHIWKMKVLVHMSLVLDSPSTFRCLLLFVLTHFLQRVSVHLEDNIVARPPSRWFHSWKLSLSRDRWWSFGAKWYHSVSPKRTDLANS